MSREQVVISHIPWRRRVELESDLRFIPIGMPEWVFRRHLETQRLRSLACPSLMYMSEDEEEEEIIPRFNHLGYEEID